MGFPRADRDGLTAALAEPYGTRRRGFGGLLQQLTQIRDGRSSWLGLPAAANVEWRLDAPVTEKGKWL
jgi:hypothetical protein